jgi:hypothetical protein
MVDELGLREGVDTLSRWMAHRVAELISRADNGDADAAHEASQLTLELWNRRSDWPTGWPPPRSAQAIERLADAATPIESGFGPREREPEPDEDPWLGRLRAVARLLGEELEIWRRLALVRLDIDPEMENAKAADPELSEEERQTLRNLALLKRLSVERFQAIEGDQTDAARIELSRKSLQELERSRRALFEAAAAAALRTDCREGLTKDDGDA